MGMDDRVLLNEKKCTECGQVTMTKQWQEVTFCANCGIRVDSAGADRTEHLAVGLTLSPDEVNQLVAGKEVELTRAVDADRHLTVHLMKAPP